MYKILLNKALLIIIMSAFNIGAQILDVRFDHLTRADGLSQGLIYSIIQDNDGYLWFATQDGLNKYDGYKFTVFQSRKNDPDALGDNWITSLCIDTAGELWIGTWDGGLNKYNAKTQTFTRFTHSEKDKNSISSNKIQTIIASKNGDIWAASWGGGVPKLNRETNTFINYKHIPGSNSISENKIYTVHEDEDGIIWIGSNTNGLDRLDPKTGVVKNFKNDPSNPHSLSHNYVLSILDDDNDMLWVATYGGGLNLFNKKTGTFKNFKNEINDLLLTSLLKDTNGNIWIGSDGGGVYFFNKTTKKFLNYKNNPLITSSLNDNRVWSLFEDRSGLIWIGTFSGGLNIYDSKKNKFKLLKKVPTESNTLIDNFIKAIYEDDNNNLWIGTNNGISILNRKDNVYKQIVNNPHNLNSLSNNRVREIVQDNDKNFWFGTWGGGLNQYNPSTGRFKHFLKDSTGNSISDNYVRRIYIDKDNIMWLATENGLNKFDMTSKIFTVIKHDPTNSHSVSSDQITSLFEDDKGNLWVGTVNGLNLFSRETSEFTNFLSVENKRGTLSSNRIREIFQDKNGSLWVGTFGDGLNKFDYSTKSFKYLKKEDGLPNDVIYDILEDDHNNLWISTNQGLCRYNYLSGKVKNYNKMDGLQDNEFNGGAAFKNSAGELFFGGINGLNIITPDEIIDNSFIPQIVITDFKLFDVSLNVEKNVTLSDTTYFDYNQNYFSFEFASLDYTAPEKNKYMYKLEGFDDEWINSGNRRYVSYTNLEPGEYIFKVKGSNSDGIWNPKETSLRIIISPPFWETIWFRLIVLLLVGSFVFGGYRFRVRSIKERNLLLQVLVDERTAELIESEKQLKEANSTKDKFFSIIAHDLKSPFMSLLGFSDVLREDYKNMGDDEIKIFADSMYNSVKGTYRLIENLLDWSRFQTGKLDCVVINLNIYDLSTQVLELYREITFEKNITIINNIKKDIYILADDYMVRTVLRNLVMNAIKFTDSNGNITLSSKDINDKVEISIADTGTGISEEDLKKLFTAGRRFSTTGLRGETGTGLGLMLCKEFMEKNNGSISVKSTMGKGSVFTITFPAGRKISTAQTIAEPL